MLNSAPNNERNANNKMHHNVGLLALNSVQSNKRNANNNMHHN